MSYSYIILIDDHAYWRGGHVFSSQESALHAMGMYDCFTSGSIKLFVSKETPTISTPDGGMIIGHLFSREGRPVTQSDLFPQSTNHVQFGTHFLENYWGDYLLIDPLTIEDCDFRVLLDPSGGIPCVYSFQGRSGFVTSDISIATRIRLYVKQIDWDFIPHFLTYPYLKTQKTGLSGIQELLPGSSLTLCGTSVIVRSEWSPWDFVAKTNRLSDPKDAAAEVRSAVATVVKSWAEVDKSILLELSGGLDSSIVAACLQGTSAHITCCTLVPPVPGADERQYAEQMAKALQVELRAEALCLDNVPFDFATPQNSVAPRIATLQNAIDDLMKKSGDMYDVTSFFSGGGGDTIFCYLGNAVPAADAFKERGLTASFVAIQNLSSLHQCTFWKAGRLTLRKLLGPPKSPCKANSTFLNPAGISVELEHHPWFNAPADAFPGDRERIFDLATTQIFRDGPPRGGKYRRRPLMSQPVMEACLKVPTWMWISGGQNRAIAREAFADILPPAILNRRSKGTFTNYSGAVYQRNKELMKDFLMTSQLQTHQLLDTESLSNFFLKDLPPRDQSFMRIFELCMIENWIRHQA